MEENLTWIINQTHITYKMWIIFFSELESNNMTMLELTGERVLEKLYENAEVSNKTGRLPNTVEEAATDLQMNFENAIANDEGNLLKSFDKATVRR